jgi:hypothetical protein
VIYYSDIRFDGGDMLVLDGDIYVWTVDEMNRRDMCRLLEVGSVEGDVSNVETLHVDELDTMINKADNISVVRGEGREILREWRK